MGPYSTLEVRDIENQNANEDSYKEAINHPASLYPECASTNERCDSAAITYNSEQPLPTAQEEVASRTSRICGLPKRIFYIVLVIVVIIIIGALAGGIAGGLSNRQHNTNNTTTDNNNSPTTSNTNPPSPSPNNPPASSNVNILNISKLTSSNWTDPNDSKGYVHRTVFFQDTHNAIIARMWDSQNKTWVTNNITDMMLKSSPMALNPLPGTPLASASGLWVTASDPEVHLFFLSTNYFIGQIYMPAMNQTLQSVIIDPGGIESLQARPGSQLTAMWQRSWEEEEPGCIFSEYGCTRGYWLAAYQAVTGEVCVANASDYHYHSASVVPQRSVAGNSSLALVPQLSPDGEGIGRTLLVFESLSSGTVGSMQKSVFADVWSSEDDSLIDDLPPPPTVQFAATVLDDFALTLFLVLLPNGTVRASWGDDFRGYTVIPRVNFSGGPDGSNVDSTANFTAIAVSEDAMFYGIVDDTILEYELDDENTLGFKYTSTVYP